MRAGFVALTVAYALSQFYRACLAVLAPLLQAEIGTTAEDLAFASGLWFATFAIMQIPVGHALDTIGPRRTAGVLLFSAALGAAVFATASGPRAVAAAMGLIGIGCAPVLMAAFYIFARVFPPKVFASLGGLLIGVSSVGDIASTVPMAWAAEAFGWRACFWAIAGFTAVIAGAILALVRDPPRLAVPEGAGGIGRIFRRRPSSSSCRSSSFTTPRSAGCAACGRAPSSPRSTASPPRRSAGRCSRWASRSSPATWPTARSTASSAPARARSSPATCSSPPRSSPSPRGRPPASPRPWRCFVPSVSSAPPTPC